MRKSRLPFLYISLLLILAIRVIWVNSTTIHYPVGKETILRGKLESEPKIEKGVYVIRLGDQVVYADLETVVHVGDYVVVRGIAKQYYIDKGTVTKVRSSQEKESFNPRKALRNIYFSNLKPRSADIISGMVIGSDDMDRNLKNDLASAGLIHLVVASGMNLTLLGGFLIALFTVFQVDRRLKVLGISSAVIFYAWLTGFNPPIVRALIMFEAVLIGGVVGRKGGGPFGLAAAGYIMLWVNPSLVASYSFLLSFASMVGQIFVSSVNIAVPKILQPLVLVVLQNFFALVFTLPIILIGFAKFSLISIISNLLVALIIEPLMVVGSLAGIVGLISSYLARVLLTPTAYALDYFLWVVDMCGKNQRFVAHVPGFNLGIAFGYYLVVFTIMYLFRPQKRT